MIRKQDILDRASEWGLRPEVVEKDYVLGWLLAGVGMMPFRAHWIFKGGTSIKKCYFETYRFSEDLDFSLLPDAAYGQEELAGNLRTLVEHVTELSGIHFPADLVIVRPRRNQQGQPTFEGRVAYRGPLQFPGTPKILFDFTQHEAVLDAPVDRPILHPYSDDLPDGPTVRAYAFPEVLAEKARALFERSRPRDLYDVIHLVENAPDQLDLAGTRRLFQQKCEGKGLDAPAASQLVEAVARDEELRSEWVNMLAHQLPAVPDLDAMLAKLPGLLGWIDEAAPAVLPESRLPAAPIPAREAPVGGGGIRYWGSGLPLETIRFAGSNRLLLEFDYHGRPRLVEPYSVRHVENTGNLLLYGWDTYAGHIKAFKVHEMQRVRSSGSVFSPRYRVEFSSSIDLAGGPATYRPGVRSGSLAGVGTSSRSKPWRRTYVFECPLCRKRFTRETNNSSLRKHQRPDGWGDCSGRHGSLVTIR
jgi:predicted nucleotidyltransferase component of viral defense system